MKTMVVIVVADGLRRDCIRPEWMPGLTRLRAESIELLRHRSAVPAVTRVCAATLATGVPPARHGLAGNKLCLVENGRLRLFDVGRPDFFDDCTRIQGHVLALPTLTERTARAGGMRIYGNASPGAAYVQDPKHFGWVFHRAGSFAPGSGMPTNAAAEITPDLEGDARMTRRFIEDLEEERSAVNLLWLGYPDTTEHHHPLGSPKHLEALMRTDENIAEVFAAASRLRSRGVDVLFIAASDHGHETVSGHVDVAAELARSGFQREAASGRLVCAPNGTAALIYLDADDSAVCGRLEALLRNASWVSEVIPRRRFGSCGICPAPALEFFVSLKRSDPAQNAFGLAGQSLACLEPGSVPTIGCGQHGGFGRAEQSPFCLVNHPEIAPSVVSTTTDLTFIAPTVLDFMGLPHEDLPGIPIQKLPAHSRLGDAS